MAHFSTIEKTVQIIYYSWLDTVDCMVLLLLDKSVPGHLASTPSQEVFLTDSGNGIIGVCGNIPGQSHRYDRGVAAGPETGTGSKFLFFPSNSIYVEDR